MADLMSATDVGQMAPGGSIVLPQRQNYGFSYIMFSQDPPSGVYSGMMLCWNNHTTSRGVRCPARLSMTNSNRSGGRFSHNVGLTLRPACQCSQAARLSSSGKIFAGGKESRIDSNSASNQACNTTLGLLVTPLTRTWPVAGWNRVSILAVPCRTCTCGYRAGRPTGCQWMPGWGMA